MRVLRELRAIGGGVLGAGAVVLAITTRWKTEGTPPPAVSIVPWFGPTAGGVGAQGRF